MSRAASWRAVFGMVFALLAFNSASAESRWARAIMDALEQPGVPLYDRLEDGFRVYDDDSCVGAVLDLQGVLSATTRQERLAVVQRCLGLVHATLVSELARSDPASAVGIADAVVTPLRDELEREVIENNSSLALDALIDPHERLYGRLETAFRAYGFDDCAASANRLALKLKLRERQTTLREVTECLELLRATTLRSLSRTRGSREAAFVVNSVLDAPEVELASRAEITNADKKFMGQSWGVGFGISVGFDDFIEDAEIVDGVVRVTEDRTVQPRIIFEFHNYFFAKKFGDPNLRTNAIRGCGLFGAVVSGGDDLLSGVGGGLICGWKAKDETKGSGFSLAFGVIYDDDVKSLGDGFEENKPPPGNETTVRFKTEARPSWILFFTRTF